jgi:SAM-dependent methyltransferase
MRKDWHAAASVEPKDAAAFWDDHWDAAGAPPTARELRGSDEYRHLCRLVPGFAAGGLAVLDCGCGRGQWMQLLREDGHRPFGVDLARQTLQALEVPSRGTAILGDFRALALAAERFDLVINWGGIEHHEDGPAVALREAWRVLRPGGHVVVTTPCHNPRLRLLDRLRGEPKAAAGARFYQYRFTPAELRGELAQAGFDDVVTRVIAGREGVSRSLGQELRPVAARLPVRAQWLLVRAGGLLLRPLLGHMVLSVGRKPGAART